MEPRRCYSDDIHKGENIDERVPLYVPPSCFETSEITCPASEVALVAILLEDVFSVLLGSLFALVEMTVRVVVVG